MKLLIHDPSYDMVKIYEVFWIDMDGITHREVYTKSEFEQRYS